MPHFTRRVEQRLARALVNWLVGSVGPGGTVQAGADALLDIESRLEPGDIILVAGRSRFSRLVCRLTRSSWSHVAIYVGRGDGRDPSRTIVEADIEAGVRMIALSDLADCRIQVVRASRLPASARDGLTRYLLDRIGRPYDLAHVIQLAQRLLFAPLPVVRWLGPRTPRRADPSRAICSTLVAHALFSAGVSLDASPLLASRTPARPAVAVDSIAELDYLVPGDFARMPGFEPVFDSGEIGPRQLAA